MKLKNVTLSLLLGAAILLFAISCNGYECEDCKDTYCDNCYPDLVVKNRSMLITDLFDNNASATVQGVFDKAGIENAADTIEEALNDRFEALVEAAQNVIKIPFAREGGVTIIVEKNPSYSNWKTIGDGKTLYVNFDTMDVIPWPAFVSMADFKTETAMITPAYDNHIASYHLLFKKFIG